MGPNASNGLERMNQFLSKGGKSGAHKPPVAVSKGNDDVSDDDSQLKRETPFIQFLRKEWSQLSLVIVGLICMGAGTGFERSLLPRMAVKTFHQESAATRLNFVATFGAAKAFANAVGGPIADRAGRKFALIVGFLCGLPVMPYVIVAKSWTGVTIMNLLFGISQGLLGSALFFLLIDLMGPSQRGIAVGIGESSIYVSTAVVNVFAGYLASKYGYRPVPFYYATGFCVIGLLSTIPLRDTLDKVKAEQSASERIAEISMRARVLNYGAAGGGKSDISLDKSLDGSFDGMSQEELERIYNRNNEQTPLLIPPEQDTGESLRSFRSDRPPPVMVAKEEPLTSVLLGLMMNPNFASLCFAGMATNFKDGFAWGSFPVYFSHVHQLNDHDTNMLVAIYPLCWGAAQAFTGYLSDKYGRRIFLVSGTGLCVVATLLYTLPKLLWGATGDTLYVSDEVMIWIFADILLGIGTACAYPALQAAAADEVEPKHRGVGVGMYRFIRDMGYVIGALVCGRLTDGIGYRATLFVVACVLALAFLAMVCIYKPRREQTRLMADNAGFLFGSSF